jgi:hypothetical protein
LAVNPGTLRSPAHPCWNNNVVGETFASRWVAARQTIGAQRSLHIRPEPIRPSQPS